MHVAVQLYDNSAFGTQASLNVRTASTRCTANRVSGGRRRILHAADRRWYRRTGRPGGPDRPDDHHEPLTGGVVGVYFGSEEGLKGVDEYGTVDPVWTQASGVPGAGWLGDGFGADVSLAGIDGDGYDDLAIGAPGEDIGTIADAGALWLLRGSATGLTAAGAKSFDQNSAGVPGTAERADRWGGQVRLADTDDDGRSELLAAAPGENTSDGVVWVLPAATTGTVADGSWSYGGGSPGAAVDE